MLLTDGVVLLDRFTDTDVDSLWAGEDDDCVRRSGLPGPFTRRDIANQIRHWQKQWQLGESGRSFAVRETVTRRLVGGCVLEIRPDDGEIAELSYWVFPPYRRRGYATRSVELVCRYAFDNLGIVRMDLYIEPKNDASLRVATKAGFLQEGLARQHDRCQSGRWDLVLFSRLRTDGLQSGCRVLRTGWAERSPRNDLLSERVHRRHGRHHDLVVSQRDLKSVVTGDIDDGIGGAAKGAMSCDRHRQTRPGPAPDELPTGRTIDRTTKQIEGVGMTQPLDGAYHKVARARKHLDELRFETKQFTDSAPYSLTGAYEPPDDHFVMRWQVHRPAPLRLGLIAGDVVHNLRSALDHVVYQLSVAGGGTGRRTQFPISEDEADYDKWADVFLDGVGSEMRATIKGLQPFHAKTAKVFHPSDLKPGHPMARNLFLLLIGRLDNVDKHRNLFPVAGVSPFQKPEFEGAISASGTYPADWILVADGAEYCRVTDLRVRKGVTGVRLKTPPPYTIVYGDAAFGPPGSPNDLWSDKTKASASAVDLSLACDAIEKIIGLFVAEI